MRLVYVERFRISLVEHCFSLSTFLNDLGKGKGVAWKKETSWGKWRSSPASLEWPPKLSRRWGLTPIAFPLSFCNTTCQTACQTCTVPSLPAEAMRVPSGDHATVYIQLE